MLTCNRGRISWGRHFGAGFELHVVLSQAHNRSVDAHYFGGVVPRCCRGALTLVHVVQKILPNVPYGLALLAMALGLWFRRERVFFTTLPLGLVNWAMLNLWPKASVCGPLWDIARAEFQLRGEDWPDMAPKGKNATGPNKKAKSVSVTVSMGVAEPTDDAPEPELVMKAADKALYRAKDKGRNRVEI